MADTTVDSLSPDVELLNRNELSGYNYRERRQEDWRENYTLYRDKVTVNRLTQRQSVNLPLMKQHVKTLLKDVDDFPIVYLENLDNDKQAEVFQNEYWKWTLEQNNAEIQDIMDKKQVFLFGRTFDQMQIVDGAVKWTIVDPEDILIDRYVDPSNIHSARFLIHKNIFLPLSTLENDDMYDQEAVAELKMWFGTQQGLIKEASNIDQLSRKNQKMVDLGMTDVDSPVLGETLVQLSMHFKYDRDGDEEQLYLYIKAEDRKILCRKPLEEVIGVTKDHYWRNHFPYNSWADDLEKQDFWSDGIADMLRTPNKVLNSFFSQLIENRTLRNYGMQYYDATNENFNPQTYQPIPWGWYGLPGKPSDIIQKVDIPDLSESLDEMGFIITMLEKASGATATQQGAQTDRKATLGEVELTLGEAKERIKGMSKFYTPAWKQRAITFLKLIEAAGDQLKPVEIFKKGRNTDNIYTKTIKYGDWKAQSGYNVKVWSQDEKNEKDQESLQKLGLVKQMIVGNARLDEIVQRKMLEFAGLTPDEINEIIKIETEKRLAIMNAQQALGMGGPGGLPPQAAPAGAPAPQLPATV